MTLSVLQWNIWYKEDIENIAEFLKAQSPDVVCLQELSGAEPAYMAEQLGYHYYHEELPIESLEGTPLTLANGIFSRFPITAQRFVWINQPKGKSGPEDEYRAYIEVGLDIEGTEVHVGTTHISYSHRFEITGHKRAEAGRLLAELAKHQKHFIFTGDLNATPGSYTIDSIQDLLQNAGPEMGQKTWTTKPFSYKGFEADELNWRLDYVFASRDMEVLSSEILQTQYSDHLPVLVKFQLPE